MFTHGGRGYPSCLYHTLGLAMLFFLLGSRTSLGQDIIELPPYEIDDGAERDTFVKNIPQDADLQERYGTDLSELYYSILPQENAYMSLFTIDERSGILRNNQAIDRDTLPDCKGLVTCSLQIDIGVLSDDLEIVKATINILDLNDNPPKFPVDTFHVSISENADVDRAAYVLPSARDPDAGKNGIQRPENYEFVANTDKLALRVTDNSDGTFDLHLVLNDKLDREKQAFYSAILIARDGGSPSLSASLPIEISVGDANDNSPTFLNSSYEITVSEKFPVNSTMLQVIAVDLDEGQNGQIVYSFDDETIREFGTMFAINSVNGNIILKSALDFETQSSFKLVVAARDMGRDSIPSHAKVSVFVQDVNDYAPKITVNAITSSHSAVVKENGDVGDFVAHVRVEDEDSGPSGVVDCILNDRRFRLYKIYKGIYKIKADAIFDREMQPFYDITIECADHGNPPLQTREAITVQIGDENDHAPVFSQARYSIKIAENNTLGQPLFWVNATDLDSGDNAVVIYSLQGDQVGVYLSVDPNTGLVSARNKFDYEQMHTFECQVVATDRGDPAESSTASIIINLEDVNDEAPVFFQNPITFATYENQEAGTEIGLVQATDPDSPPRDQVIYSLDPKRGFTNTFAIDPLSGRITLRKILDRESRSRYDLVVVASNPTGQDLPGPSSSVSVHIHVADMNDNAPLIIFPNHQNRTVQVPFRAPSGYVFSQVEARDADYGPNAELEYNVERGTGSDLFTIDRLTGILMTKTDISDIDINEYTLLITVKDNGIPQKTAMTELNVIVNKSLAAGYFPDLLQGDNTASQNQTILITMSVVTAFLVCILVLAIVYVKRKQVGKEEEFVYKCKVDLTDRVPDSALDARSSSDESAGPSPTRGPVRMLNTSPPAYGVIVAGPMGRDGEIMDSSRETGEGESEEHIMCGPTSPEGRLQQAQYSRSTPQSLQTFGSQRAYGPSPTASTSSSSSAVSGATVRPSSTLPRHRLVDHPSQVLSKPWNLTDKDMEVHRLLHMVLQDNAGDSDNASGCSAELSNTDSGRGASEDGEHGNSHHNPHRDLSPSAPHNRSQDSSEEDPSAPHGQRKQNGGRGSSPSQDNNPLKYEKVPVLPHHGRKTPTGMNKNLNVGNYPNNVFKFHQPTAPSSQDSVNQAGHVDPMYVQFNPRPAGQAGATHSTKPVDPRIPNPKINNLGRVPRAIPAQNSQMNLPNQNRTPNRGLINQKQSNLQSPRKVTSSSPRYVTFQPPAIQAHTNSPNSSANSNSQNSTTQELASSQPRKYPSSNARTPESRVTYLDSVV